MAEISARLTLDPSGVKTGADLAKNTMEGMFKGLGLKFAGIFTTTAVMAGISKAVKDGFANNVLIEQAELSMRGFMGSTSKAQSAIAMLRDEIKSKPLFSADETFKAGQMLSVFADKNVGKLKELVNVAQNLSVLSPEQGLQGAAFALREAMTNDFVSLQERMNVPRSLIKKFRDEGKEGIDVVRAALKELGVDAKNIGIMQQGWTGLTGSISTMWEETKTTLSEPLFEELKTQAQAFLDWFKINQGDILNIAKTTGEGIAATVNAAGEAIKWLKENGDIVNKTVDPMLQGGIAYVENLAGKNGWSDWGDRIYNAFDTIGQDLQGVALDTIGFWTGDDNLRVAANDAFTGSRTAASKAFTGWNHDGASKIALDVMNDATTSKQAIYDNNIKTNENIVSEREKEKARQAQAERQAEARERYEAYYKQQNKRGKSGLTFAQEEQLRAQHQHAMEQEKKKYSGKFSGPPELKMRVEGYGTIPQIMGT